VEPALQARVSRERTPHEHRISAIPYEFADLEPAMSRDTLVFHFLRHQRVCFDRMLAMVRGSELEGLPLDELIRVTERNPAQHTLYRYAAEVWNHNLFWHSMRPRAAARRPAWSGAHPRALRLVRALRTRIQGGSQRSFWQRLVVAGVAAGALEIVLTSNAGTPLVRGDTAILALDLWEHAYYLDHQNRRAAYVNTFLEELVNWDFANRTLANLAVNSDTRAVRVRTAAETDHGRLSAR